MNIIVSKLEMDGFDECTTTQLLEGQTPRLVVNGSLPTWGPVRSGGPQGLVL